ncbi:unnamed protein product, partial [Tetraodon nigroviridis]
ARRPRPRTRTPRTASGKSNLTHFPPQMCTRLAASDSK